MHCYMHPQQQHLLLLWRAVAPQHPVGVPRGYHGEGNPAKTTTLPPNRGRPPCLHSSSSSCKPHRRAKHCRQHWLMLLQLLLLPRKRLHRVLVLPVLVVVLLLVVVLVQLVV